MKAQPLALLILCFITLFACFIYSFFYPIVTPLNTFPLTLITILFFLFGIIAFGFFSFVPHAFLGLSLGAEKNALIFVYLIPIFIATYAGIKLGYLIWQDFEVKEYFLENSKKLIYLFLLAIVISIIIETALPLILNMDLWPKDMLGLNLNGKNAQNMFDLLKKGY